jgi:hypothetical protein
MKRVEINPTNDAHWQRAIGRIAEISKSQTEYQSRNKWFDIVDDNPRTLSEEQIDVMRRISHDFPTVRQDLEDAGYV